MSHLLHVSFIAVDVRSNIEPCQHHWYDVYLIQTHSLSPYTSDDN